VSGIEGYDALAVESGDQMGHGIATFAARSPSRTLVVGSASNGKQDDGAGDVDGGQGSGSAEAGQVSPLVFSKRAERILPAA